MIDNKVLVPRHRLRSRHTHTHTHITVLKTIDAAARLMDIS